MGGGFTQSDQLNIIQNSMVLAKDEINKLMELKNKVLGDKSQHIWEVSF